MLVYKNDKTLTLRAFVNSEVRALRTRRSVSSTSIQYIVAFQSITRSDLESGKTDNCTETQSCHICIELLQNWAFEKDFIDQTQKLHGRMRTH